MSAEEEAHARDYSVKRRMDEVVRAIDALLEPAGNPGRLHLRDVVALQDVRDRLNDRRAQVVRAWD